ncbi:hypothetical protein [Frankia sp. AgB32]|uniref:hypothetical protein n=1 Tax=Frankia sp. AgB32 TaxID=631119 RepID=UPI00200F3322|nr:hypothetical protein [Frankia sp. AgB32]MCK9897914.1 hypothetical protein [Frankia sp. AgB32]
MARVSRGGVFALACTGLAAGAHALGHGGSPPAAAMAAAAVAITILVVPFTARTRRLPVVVGTMLAAQAGLHVLFAVAARSAGAAHAAMTSSLCIADRGAVSEAVVREMIRTQTSLVATPHPMPVAPWHGSALMLGGHLLAAVLSAIGLHRADDAADSAARLLAALAATRTAAAVLLGRAPIGPRPPAPPPRWVATARRGRPRARWLGRALVLRGPPPGTVLA